MSDIEIALKHLIVESLLLEDVNAEDIDSTAPLFGSGLGLDSIDALELSIALGKRYGVKIKSDDPRNPAIFASVHSLAAFVREHQGPAQGEGD
jgi:acyl carrier protein